MSSDESGSSPFERVEELPATPDDEGFLGPSWDRRRFLTAAAVGTAAAAMYEGASLFRPLAAYADNLSALNCTANDVRIPGPAQILNEPCGCTGSFDAQVQFRVVNNTGTTRYCVTVHPCPVTLSDGSIFDPGDILIGDVPAKSDSLYTVTIKGYPCGQGLLCFGARGPEEDGGFPKGAACPPGECCTTVSWDVNPGCPNKVISSKCRHQQVCIQGRGSTSLDCDTSAAGVQSNCAAPCGGTATLRACTSNPAGLGPFTYELSDGQKFGPTSDTCHDFTVGPITSDSTYTVTIKDKDGCASSASVTLTATQISVSLDVSGTANCDGKLTFTASTGKDGCSYAFSVDGSEKQNGSSNTFSYGPALDGVCHTVSVVATCGGCASAPASKSVSQCATTTAC